MRPSQLLAAVVAVSSLSAAWPDVFDSGNAVAQVNNMLHVRQDNQENESSESAQPSNTREPTRTSAKDEEPTDTGKPSDEEETDKPTPTEKESGSGKPEETDKPNSTKKGDDDDKKTTSKPNPTKSYDARLPAGGISMITPAPAQGQQFYKIGEWVTMAWNYTSLKATPSAVDILASCQANQATYTLAVNQSIEATQLVLWDTKAYQDDAQKNGKTPLLTEKYTLIVYDSESSISAAPRAGYLGTSNNHIFGMYEPQEYVPWKDFKCANCNPNAGLSAFESLTLRALLITCGTTFGSLLYFAYSFGVL